jgi:hypothetical protein
MQKNRYFKLGKIISRAQPASSSKRKESPCFGGVILQLRMLIYILIIKIQYIVTTAGAD